MASLKNKPKATFPIHKQIALGQKPARKPVNQGNLAKKKGSNY